MIPFAAYTAETPNAFRWAGQPVKIAPSRGDLDPRLVQGSLLGPRESAPNRRMGVGKGLRSQLRVKYGEMENGNNSLWGPENYRQFLQVNKPPLCS